MVFGRFILHPKRLTLLIKQPIRSEFLSTKASMNSVAEAFSFFCWYSTYSGYSGGGGIFLDDTVDQVLLLLGNRGVVNAIRELLNALTSARVFYKIPRSGGVPDGPTCKNILCHTMIFDTGRLLQRR